MYYFNEFSWRYKYADGVGSSWLDVPEEGTALTFKSVTVTELVEMSVHGSLARRDRPKIKVIHPLIVVDR